jgi:hypothetical protein
MRTKNSVRNQNTIFRELFQPPQAETVTPNRPAHLDMSDEEIDKVYWKFCKADKTRMKKEAGNERQRNLVKATLLNEATETR